MKYFSKLILLTIIFLSFSCTITRPEITFGFLQLVLYETEDGVQEKYSFFIAPEDEDGIENLDILYLYHDREQYRWEIRNNDWITTVVDGTTWIGTRSITVQEGSLPRGVFRAELINKGGESAERSFTYDGDVRFPFPELEITDGFYTVTSQWPQNIFICYDNSGNFVSTVTLDNLSGAISGLRLPSSVNTVALWADDEEMFCSAFTMVVSVR